VINNARWVVVSLAVAIGSVGCGGSANPSASNSPTQPSNPGAPTQPSNPGTPTQPSNPGTPAQLTGSNVDWVNTYVGTGGDPSQNSEYGGTMPFVTTPFGMTSWTAQTRQNGIGTSSYEYHDTNIQGFIGTHQPAIWMGDYGYVTLMPSSGTFNSTPTARQQPFSRRDEISTPYYYSVVMGSNAAQKIRTEITSTDHAGYLRFTFPAGTPASVMIEATRPGVNGYVNVDMAHGEITGYNPDRMDSDLGPMLLPNFKGYFVVRFKQPMATGSTYTGGTLSTTSTQTTGNNVGAYATFDTTKNGNIVEAQVGTSFISIAQARANLNAEMPQWNFEQTEAALKDTWNKKLNIATVEGASDDQKHIFYSGLYHSLLYPKLFSENGQYYSAFDDKVHQGTSYTAFSAWDTFRAENSLLTIFAPERVGGMVKALLQDYEEGGWMPKWPNPSYTNIMISTHADSIVAEAIRKGFTGFDYNEAYQAIYKDAMTPPDGDLTNQWIDRQGGHPPYEARAGLTYYKELGYIPVDKTATDVSNDLEDTYEDWTAAQVAKAVGKEGDYEYFMDRSKNYRNLFNPATGFFQAKTYAGAWADPTWGWTEGDKWVYLYAPLHDIPGVVNLLGGQAAAAQELDTHFADGHNNQGNEPSHHYGYLYDFMGQPWKTQAAVHQIAAASYQNIPNGILGNEDCGQMSAWYIFTAMGFYPLNPASGDYMIGSPLFGRTTLNLPNGKTFIVDAPGASDNNEYIQSATLNGQPLNVPVITYEQIMAGGKLAFVMGSSPSKWAADWKPQGTNSSVMAAQKRH
jgi:predicted alpha-1,2-mannosidase